MLKIELDQAAGIAILRPESALTEADFLSASQEIDPYIEETGKLQ